MYICLNLKNEIIKKGVKEAELAPIIVPIGENTTFYVDNNGNTKIEVFDTTWIIVESLKEVAELISSSGVLVTNTDTLNKYYPEE